MEKIEYGKIETLFERDLDFNVVTSKFRSPVYNTIKTWQVTEKVDGTNVRILLDKEGVITFGGRTSSAQMPTDLLEYLQKTFTAEKMKPVLWKTEPQDVILFGEGYGAGIQKVGKNYRSDKSFRLFDVLIDGKWWLDWENVSAIADALGIKTVPYFGEMALEKIVELVETGFLSQVAIEDSGQETESEGVVARPIEPLFDKRGKRIILKLKGIDFQHPKNGEKVN